jgi:cold shock CspA family protein
MSERVRGRIKWFDHRKRYGFIERDDSLPDVFVHENEFRSRADVPWVRDGDTVEFVVEQTPKGSSATDVVVRAAE